MEKMSLVRFLAEEAADLLKQSDGVDAGARADEAAELLHLGSRILSRQESVNAELVREAA